MEATSEIVERIEAGARRYKRISDVSEDTLRSPTAPGKWTGIQILAHVADSDMAIYVRIVQAISERGNELSAMPIDGNLMMEAIRCEERPAALSLAAIQATRGLVVHTLRSIPEKRLRRKLIHPEMGEVDALFYASVMADHGLHHLDALETATAERLCS